MVYQSLTITKARQIAGPLFISHYPASKQEQLPHPALTSFSHNSYNHRYQYIHLCLIWISGLIGFNYRNIELIDCDYLDNVLILSQSNSFST